MARCWTPSVQISQANLQALRRAHEAGIEIVLVTGRRHRFALPIAESLGFDLWLISSNGAVTRSTRGELFHQDLLPQGDGPQALPAHATSIRNHMVLTFDREGMGAIVCENRERLYGVIQRWMEKNAPYIEYVSPIAKALTEDPIQAMFCGPVELMQQAQRDAAVLRFRRRVHRAAHAIRLRDLVHRRHP